MELQNNLPYIVWILATIIACGQSYWCTRQRSESIRHVVTEIQKCNQTYEDSCSFFSWDKCTYSELVDCPVQKNITVTRYFVVEECCPGFKLNPINNITCIPTSETALKSAVTALKAGKGVGPVPLGGTWSPIDVSPTTASGDGNAAHVNTDDSEGLLFGLSHGAYAGIICSMLFFLCVFVLIMLHVRKRARKAQLKETKSGKVVTMSEIETTQKMLHSSSEVC